MLFFLQYFNKAIKQTNQAWDAREGLRRQGLGRAVSKDRITLSCGDEYSWLRMGWGGDCS